jgi:6-phosphofructokinase 1
VDLAPVAGPASVHYGIDITGLGAERRGGETGPAAQQRKAAERRDGAQPALAGEREQVEAAAEDERAGDEEPAGGDGSMRIVSKLCERAGIGMVGVPKTIDNDVYCTEYSVGFATAINVVTEALDRLQPTAASHHRVMILEVMGRDTGHIALNGGIAGGADIILVPELPYTVAGVARRIRELLAQGRTHALVVVAEGVKTEEGAKASVSDANGLYRYGGIGHYLMEKLAPHTQVDIRVTILGHVQRGGTPSPRDRLLASAFGVHAVEMVAQRRFSRMVAWHDRGVIDVPLSEVTIGARTVDPNDALIRTARGLGIHMGEQRAKKRE